MEKKTYLKKMVIIACGLLLSGASVQAMSKTVEKRKEVIVIKQQVKDQRQLQRERAAEAEAKKKFSEDYFYCTTALKLGDIKEAKAIAATYAAHAHTSPAAKGYSDRITLLYENGRALARAGQATADLKPVPTQQYTIVGHNSDGALISGVSQPETSTDWLTQRQQPERAASSSATSSSKDTQSRNEIVPEAQSQIYYGTNAGTKYSHGQALTDSATSRCTNWSNESGVSEPLIVSYEDARASIAGNKELLAQHIQALKEFIDKIAKAPYSMSVSELLVFLESNLPSLAGASDKVNYMLSADVRKLCQRLANIVCNEDGSYKGIVTPRDKNKWAYAVADFMKKIYKEDYQERVSGLADAGCPGFDAVAYEKSEYKSSFGLKWQKVSFVLKYKFPFNDIGDTKHAKGTLTANRFNKDIKSMEAALARGDRRSADSIVNQYERGHDTVKAGLVRGIYDKAVQRAEETKRAAEQAARSENVPALQSNTSPDVMESRMQWPDDMHIGPGENSDFVVSPVDFIRTGADDDCVYREHMATKEEVLSSIQDGPLKGFISAVYDYVAVQWEDGKNEVSSLLNEMAARNEVHREQTNELMQRYVNDLASGKSPLDILQEAIYELSDVSEAQEKMCQDIAVLKALTACVGKGITYFNENSEKIEKARQLALAGRVPEAVALAGGVDLLSTRAAEKLIERLQRPVKFAGETVRGLVDLANMFADRISPLGNSERRSDEMQEFVSRLENATPDEIYDFTSGFIADSIALVAAQKVYVKTRAKLGTDGKPTQTTAIAEVDVATGQATQVLVVNQSADAVLKNGYYEVNGLKFSEYYYNKLWDNGRGAPSLVAKEIIECAISVAPDIKRAGFYRYVHGGWELIYNPVTKEVWHLQPCYKK